LCCYTYGNMFDVSNLVYIIPALFIAMAFHEAMHAFAADWLGDTTAREEGRITLNPLAHIDPVMTIALPAVLLFLGLPPILAAKPVPFNPARVKYDEFGAAIIGVAGPLTNLLLAAITAGILKLVVLPEIATTALVVFCVLNVALFVFNMLPIPPLDGSRLLYAFAPESLQRLMAQIEAMGFTFLIIILVVLLPVIGPILQNLNQSLLRFLL
jgi:Zn-dependent protease